jgi:hypothetical protein
MSQLNVVQKPFLQRVFGIGLVALIASFVVFNSQASPVRAWPFTHTQAMVLSGFSGPGPTTGVFAATVKSDNSGNIFVLGPTGGTIEVNPASPSTKIGTGAEVSYYLSKFSSTGDHQWTRDWLEVAGGPFVEFLDFTPTSSGEIVIVGTTTAGFDLDPDPAVTRTVTSTSPLTGVILKLTSDGQLSMVREIPATASVAIQSVAVTSSGDIVVSGGYEGTVDFNAAGGPGGLSFASTSQIDGFVAMFSSTGVERWVARVEGAFLESIEKINVASDGGVFVALTMSVDVVLKDAAGRSEPLVKAIADGFGDTLVWRLNATGAHQWSMMHDTGASQNDVMRTTTQLTDGSLLVLTALNDIVRVGSDGSRLSVTRFNGVVKSITQVNSGKVIVVGEFANTIDMDPSSGVASFTSATAGEQDVFVTILSSALSYESTVVIPASGVQYADSVFASADGGWHISGRSVPVTLNLSNTSDAASFSPAAGADSMLFVVGYNAAGTTATTTTTTTTVAPALVLAPTRASYVTGNKKVTVTWAAVSGAASYVVTTSSGSVACTSTTTSCVLSGRRNGKVYTYSVRAVNAAEIPSVDSRQVKAIPGFKLRTTSYKVKKTPLLTSIVSTPSKGTKTWTVVSGNCRKIGARLLMPTKKGSCRLRLSVTKKGSYPAMVTTVAITVTK